MAQGYYEGQYAPQPGRIPSGDPYAAQPGRMGRMVNLAGAALSVALLCGVGVWSYRLMVRDVTGVPVIRALAGPARQSPEDPGGRQAAYQGLAVNTVAAEGGAASAAQTIALAPQSLDLSAEDRSAEVMTARGSPITAPGAVQVAAPAPVAAPSAAPVSITQAAASQNLQIIPASAPGVSRSPYPRARNATVVASAASRPVAAVQAVAQAPLSGGTDAQAEALLQELVTRLSTSPVTEVDPDTLAPGTRLVQLGVYDDEAAARGAWEAINERFPSFLESRGRIIEPATSGGRVFYRLRAAGFSDEPEARRFCTMLMAESVDCIPTLIR